MTHQKKKKASVFVVIFLIFGLTGVGLIIGGLIYMRSSLKFQSIAVEVSGTITDITTRLDSDGDARHTVLVSYSYGGRDFDNVPLNFYSSSMYEGKEIPLLIDPQDPGHMTSRSGNTFGYMMLLGMGLIFSLVGFIPLGVMLIGSRRDRKLVENGTILQATVEFVDLNRSVTYNGRHPYQIFCTYQDAYRDVTYRFKSKNLMREPGYAPGDFIKVYVNPQDYSKYVVYVEETVNPKVIDYT